MEPFYSDDYVTLYNADSLEHPELWDAGDVLVTDPPYGMNFVSGKNKRDKFGLIHGDDSTDLRDRMLADWARGGACRPALVFGNWRNAKPDGVRQRLVWCKTDTPGMGDLKLPWGPADEEIYVMGKGWDVSKLDVKREGSVVPFGRPHGDETKYGHPTPKPVGLLMELIRRCPDGVVVDPFAGSGATLMACRKLGRRCIGVELEERYCKGAVKRLTEPEQLDLAL